MGCRLRSSTGDSRYYAPLDRRQGSLLNMIIVSCYRPFGKQFSRYASSETLADRLVVELLIFDTMCLLLNLWYVVD